MGYWGTFIVARSGQPVMLIGYSPGAGRWGGWLMLERIVRPL